MTRQEIIDALSFCASDARFPREECGESCPLFLPAYSGVKKTIKRRQEHEHTRQSV